MEENSGKGTEEGPGWPAPSVAQTVIDAWIPNCNQTSDLTSSAKEAASYSLESTEMKREAEEVDTVLGAQFIVAEKDAQSTSFDPDVTPSLPKPNRDEKLTDRKAEAQPPKSDIIAMGGDEQPAPVPLNNQKEKDDLQQGKEAAEKKQPLQQSAVIKQDPLTALGSDLFRKVLLAFQMESSLAGVIGLGQVSTAWSQAVVKALDSQKVLFYFRQYSDLRSYYEMLLTYNLLDDPFYKIPADKPSEVIGSFSMLPPLYNSGSDHSHQEVGSASRRSPPPNSLDALSQSLTNVTKLVAVEIYTMDFETPGLLHGRPFVGLLDRLAFRLESLVITSAPSSSAQNSLSIMANLRRLELYGLDGRLSTLNLDLLRIVLGRLEHLVLASRRPAKRLPCLNTWKKLFGYLNGGQLRHLGLVGFTGLEGHFPWEALFEELPAERRLVVDRLRSLQLGVTSLADLQALVRIFSAPQARLERLNFGTEAVENLTLTTVFTTLASLTHLTDLSLRLEQHTGEDAQSFRSLFGQPRLPTITSFSMTAPEAVPLQTIPHLPALLGHFLPNLAVLNLRDYSWAGAATTDEASGDFERRLQREGRHVTISWTGDFHRAVGSPFPGRLLAFTAQVGASLRGAYNALPGRCSSFFCDAKVHHAGQPQCLAKMRQMEGLLKEGPGEEELMRSPLPPVDPYEEWDSDESSDSSESSESAESSLLHLSPAAEWDYFTQAWIYEDCCLRRRQQKKLKTEQAESSSEMMRAVAGPSPKDGAGGPSGGVSKDGNGGGGGGGPSGSKDDDGGGSSGSEGRVAKG